ncbi:MAG: PDZ domain-containing protein, partial [Actinomycetes bacterium]
GVTLSHGSRGPRVKALSPGGPSDRLLRPGDQILSVNNMTISSPAQLFSGVLSAQVGNFVSLRLFREGKTLTVRIKLVAKP